MSQPSQYPQQAQPAYGQPGNGQPQGYYAQPAPSPIIIQQQAPAQKKSKKDGFCLGW